MTKLRSKRGKRVGKKRSGDEPVRSSGDEMKEESMRELSVVVRQSGAHGEADEDRFLTGDEKVFNAGIALAEYCTRHLEPFMEFLSSVRDEELTLDGLGKCCSFVMSNDDSYDSGVDFSANNSGVGVALGTTERVSRVKESSYKGSASAEEIVEVFHPDPGTLQKRISEDSGSRELENSVEDEDNCEANCSGSPGPRRRRHGCRILSSDESDEDDQVVKKNEDNSKPNLIPFSPDITSFRAVTRRSLLQQFDALAVDSTQPGPAPDEVQELSRKDTGTPADSTKSNTEVETSSDEDIKVLSVKVSKDSAKVRSKQPKGHTQKANESHPSIRKHRRTKASLCETSSPSPPRSAPRSTRRLRSREESLNLNHSRDVEILGEITRSKSFNSNSTAAAESSTTRKPKNAANIGTSRRPSRKRSSKIASIIPSDSDDDIKLISPAPPAKKMKVVNNKPKPSRSSHGRYSLRSNK